MPEEVTARTVLLVVVIGKATAAGKTGERKKTVVRLVSTGPGSLVSVVVLRESKFSWLKSFLCFTAF